VIAENDPEGGIILQVDTRKILDVHEIKNPTVSDLGSSQ
jgi:hypothetical protein